MPLNILNNFIPNRTKTFTDSELPWMTDDNKNKIKLNKFYLQYMRNQRHIHSLLKIENFNKISNLTTKSMKATFKLLM